jgi:hypothetical protein
MGECEVNERADELEYLIWFFQNADFGPADSDVRLAMNQGFVEATGKALPIGYEDEGYEGEG